MYENISLPEYEYLARNCPRLGDGQTVRSDPGTRFYLAEFELVRPIGSILEASNPDHAVSEDGKLRLSLDQWYRSMNSVRYVTSLDYAQFLREMNSGSSMLHQKQSTVRQHPSGKREEVGHSQLQASVLAPSYPLALT